MTDIEKIVNRIGELYMQFMEPSAEVSLALHARELAFRARDYFAAASIIEREGGPPLWLPMLQLTGHAVELCLKACLASVNVTPPIGHDIVSLLQQVQGHGFELDSSMCSAIVHLHHFYFQDLGSGTRHKTRYPSRHAERLGGSVPNNSTFAAIVSKLLDQAEKRART